MAYTKKDLERMKEYFGIYKYLVKLSTNYPFKIDTLELALEYEDVSEVTFNDIYNIVIRPTHYDKRTNMYKLANVLSKTEGRNYMKYREFLEKNFYLVDEGNITDIIEKETSVKPYVKREFIKSQKRTCYLIEFRVKYNNETIGKIKAVSKFKRQGWNI